MTNIKAAFKKAGKRAKFVPVAGIAMLSAACATTEPYQIVSDPTLNTNTCRIERVASTYLGDEAIDERTLVAGLDSECLQAERDATVAAGMAEAFFITTFEQSSDPQQVETYGEAMLAALYGDNPVARQAVESVLRENNTDQGDIAIRVNEARRQMREIVAPENCTQTDVTAPNGETMRVRDCRTITGSLDTRQWNPTNIRLGSNLG